MLNGLFQALHDNTIEVLGLLIFFPLFFLMIYNHFSFKNNHLSMQLKTILNKEDKKKKKEAKFRTVLNKIFEKKGKELELKMEQANILFKKEEYLSMMLLGIGLGFVLGFSVFPFSGIWMKIFDFINFYLLKFTIARTFSGLFFAAAGYFLPEILIKYRIFKRKKDLDDQIEDALLSMAEALRSGLVPQEAIRFVGEELAEPMGLEFKRASQEIRSGMDPLKALSEMKNRVDLQDFKLAISAIEIQTETGGKLESLLREMVKIISERKLLKKEMDKAIATSKQTGFMLLGAPILFALLFSRLNKEGFDLLLNSKIGIALIVIGVVSYLIGAVIIFNVIRGVSKAA